MRAKSGSSNGACELFSKRKRFCLGSGTCLVEDTTVIGRDIVGVKEDAFLYWTNVRQKVVCWEMAGGVYVA